MIISLLIVYNFKILPWVNIFTSSFILFTFFISSFFFSCLVRFFEERHVATVSRTFSPRGRSYRGDESALILAIFFQPCHKQTMVCTVVLSAAALASQTHYSYLNEFSAGSLFPSFDLLCSPFRPDPHYPRVSIFARNYESSLFLFLQ